MRHTKAIIWIRGARKAFETFPEVAQKRMEYALTIAAEGSMADIAKPFKGLGSGVFEIALKHGGNAFHAVQLGDAVYVFDAFQKKSTQGIKTPQADVDRITERFKRLKEMMK